MKESNLTLIYFTAVILSILFGYLYKNNNTIFLLLSLFFGMINVIITLIWIFRFFKILFQK
jgi:hypothetical protein